MVQLAALAAALITIAVGTVSHTNELDQTGPTTWSTGGPCWREGSSSERQELWGLQGPSPCALYPWH